MIRLTNILAMAIVVFLFTGCKVNDSAIGSSIGGKPVWDMTLRQCSMAISYDDRAFEFEGLEFTISESRTINLGSFETETRLIREASELVQLMDLQQYQACQMALGEGESLKREAMERMNDLYAFAAALSRVKSNADLEIVLRMYSSNTR